MARVGGQKTGRAAYEADLVKRPTYHDGSPRKQWDQLGALEQWTWTRPLSDEPANA